MWTPRSPAVARAREHGEQDATIAVALPEVGVGEGHDLRQKGVEAHVGVVVWRAEGGT